MSYTTRIPVVALALALALGLMLGCMPVIDPAAPPAAFDPPLEPDAGQWPLWVVQTPDAVRPPPPPDAAATRAELAELKQRLAALDADGQAQVAFWNAGSPSYRWLDLAIAEHAVAGINPTPRYARNMALLNVAIYDAMIIAWDAKYAYNRPRPLQADPTLRPLIATPHSPSYPSEHAVAAGAASAILTYLFPERAALYATLADEAAHSRLLAGVHYPSDVEAGLALGRAVAAQVIDRARHDGSDTVWDGVMPTEPGHWTGEAPVQPTTAAWQTWVLDSVESVLPPPPPAYDSEQMQLELTALKAITPTFATTAAAYFWQSPRGVIQYTYGTAARLLFEHGLDANPPQAARVYAAMSTAQADAFIACYAAKYTYWSMRPSQVDPTFKPLLPLPNFPAYPSAHSCQTGAVMTVLESFFPADAPALWKTAEETGLSRLWGGIHLQSDIDAGFVLGKAVGARVVEHLAALTP